MSTICSAISRTMSAQRASSCHSVENLHAAETPKEAILLRTISAAMQIPAMLVPPAPRLVGVEPNPGPPKGLASRLASVGSALGSALARSQKKKKRGPATVSKRVVAIAKGSSRSRPRQPQVSRTRMSGLSNSMTSSSMTAPVAYRTARTNHYQRPTMTHKFTSANLFIKTDTNGVPYIVTQVSAPGTPGDRTLELNPAGTGSSNQNPPFGPQTQLHAAAFDKFYFDSLSYEFEGMKTLNDSPGIIIIGYVQDPVEFTTESVADLFSKLSGVDLSKSGPAWGCWSQDVSPLLEREELFISNLSTPSGIQSYLNERQTCQGQILIAGASLTPSTTVGILRLKGVLKFFDTALPEPSQLPPGDSQELPEIAYADSQTYDASMGNPIGLSPLVVTGASLPVIYTEPLRIRGSGVYRFEYQWSSSTGVVTAGATATVADQGTALSALLDTSTSSAPPYSFLLLVGVYIPPGSDPEADFVEVSLTGPDQLTSGQFHLKLTREPDSATVPSLLRMYTRELRAHPPSSPSSPSPSSSRLPSRAPSLERSVHISRSVAQTLRSLVP